VNRHFEHDGDKNMEDTIENAPEVGSSSSAGSLFILCHSKYHTHAKTDVKAAWEHMGVRLSTWEGNETTLKAVVYDRQKSP
jgi:hypothetical protein